MDEFAVEDAREMAFQAKEQMRTLEEVTGPGKVAKHCACLPLHRVNHCCFWFATTKLHKHCGDGSPCEGKKARPDDRQSFHAKTLGAVLKKICAPHTWLHASGASPGQGHNGEGQGLGPR